MKTCQSADGKFFESFMRNKRALKDFTNGREHKALFGFSFSIDSCRSTDTLLEFSGEISIGHFMTTYQIWF